ncbi:MAG: hypothetical protein E4H17_01245 [Gemmatimonadales bacterium]|nr:MAG: hypothetical protein E4H17_01245 [Gemmatimonadales bacterium]
MLDSIRVRHASIAALTAILCAVLPSTGWTWGSVGHHYIAQHYSQHLPAYIDGLRAYDSVVDLHVTDADTRKSYTPGESVRHYIDIDYYPEFFAGTLPHTRTVLEALYSVTIVTNNGVLPWAIDEVMTTLTQQFQTQQWSDASLTIADLCHYVGDANMPLHCTVNYDGQLTGNTGIHSRYESTMISTYVGQLDTPAMTVTYFPSPLDATFDVIAASWAGVSPILTADNVAKAASGGLYNSTYYASLWNSTHTLTQARFDTASVVTASLVYTAWVKAGLPTVPGSSAVPPLAMPPMVADAGVRLDAGPTPFRDVLTVRFAGGSAMSVDVFDVRGARVARLADNVAGEGSVTWRPGSSGAPVGPGLYFVRLSGPGTNLVRRVTLVQ